MTRERLAAIGLLLGLAGSPASAATFVVDTSVDAVDATPGDGLCATTVGACALRAAVQEANALGGPDAIVLPAGTYLLTLAGPGEDAGAAGDLDVREALAIDGAGSATTVIDARGASPVLEAGVAGFSLPPLGTLAITGVTLRNGRAQSGDDCNGPIALASTPGICTNGMALELTDSVVEANAGDGVLVLGNLALTRTSVRDNVKLGTIGVGVTVLFGALEIGASTISGSGSIGVLAQGVPVTIRNSTLSANRIGLSVGFMCEPPQIPCPVLPAPVLLANVTLAGHDVAAVNDEVMVLPGGSSGTVPVVVRNSVFSGNAADCQGSLSSEGYTAFAAPGTCAIATGPGDLLAVPTNLGPLRNNGGATATHAPGPASPVVNAANPAAPGSNGAACEAVDQREIARPVGGVCDMGAVETACGDTVVDPGETCDDGNASDDDGCQRNCTLAGCGNGVAEPGEGCDDGNLADGDCCAANCTLDAPGAACTSDGDPCTTDRCSATGECLHPTAPDGTSCDDGNTCSLNDRCDSGTCLGFGCPFCTVCRPGFGCVAPPDTCEDGASSRVTLLDRSSGEDIVRWHWVGALPLTSAEFGAASGGLCGEDASGHAFLLASTGASGGCDPFGCWSTGDGQQEFGSGPLAAGMVRIRFTEGPPPTIVLRASGEAASLPALPLSSPVRLWYQRVAGGRCFDLRWDAGIRRNTAKVFRAR